MKGNQGFTLIEVMVALVVVTIGIIAILGLIPVGLQSARNAADMTLIATIAQDTFSYMRIRATQNWPPNHIDRYFDADGFDSTPTSPSRYFHITVNPKQLILNGVPMELYETDAIITWPALSAHPMNTNTFVTEIARMHT